jgi:mannose-6-phosphate isomerase-like protein (cupin superfamily)
MDKAAPVRRVVTGHDAAGKAVVVLDGDAPNVRVREAAKLTSTLLWVEDETPADNGGDADKSLRDVGVAPPNTGSVFRLVEFPPEAEAGEFDNAAMKAEMGLDAHADAPARHPGMHRTRSVDYAVVISGEIDMLLDDSEVHLKAGDVVVQRGTNHAWANRGTEPCRIAFVLVDAKPL